MPRQKGVKNDPNRTPIAFKQANVRRAIRAVEAAGYRPSHVEIDSTTGKIVVAIGKPGEPESNSEVEQWLGKQHAHKTAP
jgi:hypothetical protein